MAPEKEVVPEVQQPEFADSRDPCHARMLTRGRVRRMAFEFAGEHLSVTLGTGEDRGVLTVVINRPPVNALSRAVQEELRRVAVAVNADDDVRVVIITGG